MAVCMKHLLDTDICIYTIKGSHQAIAEHMNQLRIGDCVVSVITLHELVYGAYKSQAVEKNLRMAHKMLRPLRKIVFDEDCAEASAKIRAELARQGNPVGLMDTHIAATALVYNLTLVSNNMREFSRIAGLRVENWTLPPDSSPTS